MKRLLLFIVVFGISLGTFACGDDPVDPADGKCLINSTTCIDGVLVTCEQDKDPVRTDCASGECNEAGTACKEVVTEKCTETKTSCTDGVLTVCEEGKDPAVTDCDPKECNAEGTGCKVVATDKCVETKTSCEDGVLTVCEKDKDPVVSDCDPKECNEEGTACKEVVEDCTENVCDAEDVTKIRICDTDTGVLAEAVVCETNEEEYPGVAFVCDPLEKVCVPECEDNACVDDDVTKIQLCGNDGVLALPTECADGKVCGSVEGDAIDCTDCTENVCVGDQIRICTDGSLAEAADCEGAGAKCDPETKVCITPDA